MWWSSKSISSDMNLEEESHALRFHCVQKEDPNQVEILWLAKLVFGLKQSSTHFIIQPVTQSSIPLKLLK